MTKIQYTPEQKLKVLQTLDEIQNVNQTARMYQIKSTKTIRYWKNREQVKMLDRCNRAANNKTKRRRLFGGGCKPKFSSIENELNNWIDSKRHEKLAVSCKAARERAAYINKNSINATNFKASRGWLQRYFKRFLRSLRRRTHLATQNNKCATITRNTILSHLNVLNYVATNYEKKNIFNMDETPLYIDMPAATTIDNVGEKSIDVVTSGYEKHRISCVLTISASGALTKTFVIMQKLVKVPKVNLPENIHLAVSKSGFMDTKLMKEYFQMIIKPIAKNAGEIVLIMDQFILTSWKRYLGIYGRNRN